MSGLKPCPWCGSTSVGEENFPAADAEWIECFDCGAHGPGMRTFQEARAAWNARPEPVAVTAEEVGSALLRACPAAADDFRAFDYEAATTAVLTLLREKGIKV